MNYLQAFGSLWLLTHLVIGNNSIARSTGNAQFAGSDTCKACHSRQYDDWLLSDHFKAMAPATSSTVLGDFDQVSVTFHGIKSQLFKQDGQFFVKTLSLDGTLQTYPVQYTLGHYPLQQYLVTLDNGHIQALNIAWDSRPKSAGGNRWFHLQPKENITPEHPFFWQSHFQNWNGHCAKCHVTHFEKNYSVNQHQYDSTWSEPNVACEACHGPASKHLTWAQSSAKTKANTEGKGFDNAALAPPQWLKTQPAKLAERRDAKQSAHIHMCGSCHSRRQELTPGELTRDYHDQHLIALIDNPLYFPDGQIRDEVYVLGSFLQSKMHHKGVTCSNCHNPHSGKPHIEGNGLCLQCHQPRYNTPSHHHHKQTSTGSQCINCHMPTRTYMGVDARRDHRFVIPYPGHSPNSQTPNSCLQCHSTKDHQWLLQQFKGWQLPVDKPGWNAAMEQAWQGNMNASAPLLEAANDGEYSDFMRASFIAQLARIPSQSSIDQALAALGDKNPLVRRAAIEALGHTAPQTRWMALKPMLLDPVRSVRYRAMNYLVDLLPHLPEIEKSHLQDLIKEYRHILKQTEDFPETQVAIGLLERSLGRPLKAVAAYQHALRIAPFHVPARINLADMYRILPEREKEEKTLTQGLALVPDSGLLHHSYGLFLVRQQQRQKALLYLEKAMEKADAEPRFAYIYAVALDDQKRTLEAVRILKRASQRWPNQYDLLSTLVMYLEKTDQLQAVLPPLKQLYRLAPQSPQVRRWMSRYGKPD